MGRPRDYASRSWCRPRGGGPGPSATKASQQARTQHRGAEISGITEKQGFMGASRGYMSRHRAKRTNSFSEPAPGRLTYGGATSANRFLRVWVARFIGGRVRNCNRLGCPAATVVLRNGKCSVLPPSGPIEDWRSRRRLSGSGKTTLIRNGNLQVCRGIYRKPLARKPKFIPHFWDSRRRLTRGIPEISARLC
jgi:hypothetical protein